MSPNGTRIGLPSTPTLDDAQNVKWSIRGDGYVLRNNIATNGKATEILLFNNNIYVKSPTGGYWWQWKGNNTWQKLTLADPSATAPVPPPSTSILASAQNTRTGTTYANVQQALDAAQDGDTVEISPGFLYYPQNCGNGAPYGGGTACHLTMRNNITIKAKDLSNRPIIKPAGTWIDADGIIIPAPFDTGVGRKLDVIIDGIVIQDMGNVNNLDCAILLRGKRSKGIPASVTLRHIDVFRCSGGIKGWCDRFLLENIECADGGNNSGQEHNFYVGGRESVIARNIHSWRSIDSILDGHIFKVRAKEILIEDCNFDNFDGDASAVLQACNGGKLTMRRTILKQGIRASNRKGIIWYGDEGNWNVEDSNDIPVFEAWVAEWQSWDHSYDIQNCTFVDGLNGSNLIHFSNVSPPRYREIFKNNIYPVTSIPPIVVPPAPAPIPAPSPAPVPTPSPSPILISPAWRKGIAPRTWAEIDTNLLEINPERNPALNPNYGKASGWEAPWHGIEGFGALYSSWSGGAFNRRSHVLRLSGGGHGAYAGNELLDLDTSKDKLEWVLARPPTGAIGNEGALNDGKEASDEYFDKAPRSTHTYNQLAWGGDAFYQMGGSNYAASGTGQHLFKYDNGWTNLGAAPNAGLRYGGMCHDELRSQVLLISATNAQPISIYDVASKNWTTTAQLSTFGGYTRLILVPEHDIVVVAAVDGTVAVYDYGRTNTNGLLTVPKISGKCSIDGTTYAYPITGEWVPELNAIVLWEGGDSFAVLTLPTSNVMAGTWIWSRLVPAASNAVTPKVGTLYGTYGRFFYSPSLQGFGLVNGPVFNFFALK